MPEQPPIPSMHVLPVHAFSPQQSVADRQWPPTCEQTVEHWFSSVQSLLRHSFGKLHEPLSILQYPLKKNVISGQQSAGFCVAMPCERHPQSSWQVS
jgi:hypothetical protein